MAVIAPNGWPAYCADWPMVASEVRTVGACQYRRETRQDPENPLRTLRMDFPIPTKLKAGRGFVSAPEYSNPELAVA